MTNNNGEIRDEKGKFIPGHHATNKKRDRTQTDKLLTALRKAGQKKGLKFWNVVAEKAFIDKEIMKLVVSKLVPSLNELSGLGGSAVNVTMNKVIYEDPDKKPAQD